MEAGQLPRPPEQQVRARVRPVSLVPAAGRCRGRRAKHGLYSQHTDAPPPTHPACSKGYFTGSCLKCVSKKWKPQRPSHDDWRPPFWGPMLGSRCGGWAGGRARWGDLLKLPRPTSQPLSAFFRFAAAAPSAPTPAVSAARRRASGLRTGGARRTTATSASPCSAPGAHRSSGHRPGCRHGNASCGPLGRACACVCATSRPASCLCMPPPLCRPRTNRLPLAHPPCALQLQHRLSQQ